MNKNRILDERSNIYYDNTELKVINEDKKILTSQINKKLLKKELTFFNNQKKCSKLIVKKLCDRKILNVMVYALTQSGKTGTMISLLKNYIKKNIIPIENLYVITGLSSKEWVNQTKNRMPKCLSERIFHGNNLKKKFVNDIQGKKNVLIIIDEIQIAAKEGQLLHEAFNNAGFYNKETLLEKDIKFIEFTATPDGNILDQMDWGKHSSKINMKSGRNYTSCFKLLKKGRVKQYKNLCGYDKDTGAVDATLIEQNFEELKKIINKYNKPRYHIIRSPNGKLIDVVINNFQNYFGNIKFHKYYSEGEIENINELLIQEPNQHEFIFIKEKLRCSKTIFKKNLGVAYERYTKYPDDAVIIQSLLGRLTGYDDNKETLIYTNIDSVKKYEKLWKSDFEDKTINWKSKTTKRKNKILISKGTFNNPILINGLIIKKNK